VKEYVAPQVTYIELRTEEKISQCILVPPEIGACPIGRDLCWVNVGS